MPSLVKGLISLYKLYNSITLLLNKGNLLPVKEKRENKQISVGNITKRIIIRASFNTA